MKKALKEMRIAAGLSQRDVSELMGYTTPQFISNWERGVSSPPLLAMGKIAKIYNQDAGKLRRIRMEAEIEKIKAKYGYHKKKR